jgi:hypothetical protein
MALDNMEAAGALVSALSDSAGAASTMITRLSDSFLNMDASMKTVVQGIDGVIKLFNSAIGKTESLAAAVSAIEGVQKKLEGGYDSYKRIADGLKSAGDAANKMAGVMSASSQSINTALASTIKTSTEVVKTYGQNGELISTSFRTTEEMAAQVASSYSSSVDTMAMSAATTGETVGEMAQKVSASGPAAAATAPAIKGFGTALNTALGVVGLVVTGVSLLVDVFTKLFSADEATQKMADGIHNMVSASDESTNAYQKSSAEMATQGEMANGLVSKLDTLQKAGAQTGVNQQRMAEIVGQLNILYPDLGLSIDETTGELNKNIDTIKASVEAMQKEAEEAAKKEYYNDLLKQQIEMETQKKVLEEDIAKMTASKADLDIQEQANLKAKQEAYDELCPELEDVQKNIEVLNDELYANTENETENSTAILYNADAILTKMANGQAFTDAEIENTQILIDSGNVLTEAQAEQLQSQIDAQEAAKEEYARIMEERVTLATDAFNRIDQGQAISVQSMIDNLTANTQAMSTWIDNMAILADSGLDEGFLEQLREKGPEAGAQVAEMVRYMQETGDTEFTAFNEALSEAAASGVKSMDSEMSTEEAKGIAGKMMDDNAEGVASNTSLAQSVTQSVVDAKTSMESQVTSSNFASIGSTIINDIITGLNEAKETLLSTAAEIASSLKSTLTIRGRITATASGRTASVDIGWYKTGAIFTSPTVIGVGEAGAEAVIPINKLGGFIANAMQRIGLDSKLQAIMERSNESADAIMRSLTGGMYQSIANNTNISSRTQNFGPIVIQQPVKTPAETARAIKREMVMLLG